MEKQTIKFVEQKVSFKNFFNNKTDLTENQKKYGVAVDSANIYYAFGEKYYITKIKEFALNSKISVVVNYGYRGDDYDKIKNDNITVFKPVSLSVIYKGKVFRIKGFSSELDDSLFNIISSLTLTDGISNDAMKDKIHILLTLLYRMLFGDYENNDVILCCQGVKTTNGESDDFNIQIPLFEYVNYINKVRKFRFGYNPSELIKNQKEAQKMENCLNIMKQTHREIMYHNIKIKHGEFALLRYRVLEAHVAYKEKAKKEKEDQKKITIPHKLNDESPDLIPIPTGNEQNADLIVDTLTTKIEDDEVKDLNRIADDFRRILHFCQNQIDGLKDHLIITTNTVKEYIEYPAVEISNSVNELASQEAAENTKRKFPSIEGESDDFDNQHSNKRSKK